MSRGATLLVAKYALKRALEPDRFGRGERISVIKLSEGDDYGLYGRAINDFGTPLMARGTKGQIRALGVRID